MKRLTLITLLVGMAVLLQPPPASATSIDLVPLAPSGGFQDVNVVVAGLPAGEIVAAFDMDVLYNPLEATATGVDFGILLGDPFFFEAITGVVLSSGFADFAELSLLSDADLQTLQSPSGGTFTLATLHFQLIPNNDVGPGYALSWTAGNDVKGALNSVIYPEQNPIPEPSTVLLISSGLLGLLAFRRKFSK